jgi:PAS domain S-box-containing protein
MALHFEELLKNIHWIAVLLDTQGQVVCASDFLLNLTGSTRDEMVGCDWFRNVVSPEQPEVKQRFLKNLEDGECPAPFESLICVPQGGERLFVWSSTILRDPSGQVIGTTCFGEDISDCRQTEFELHRTSRALRAISECSRALVCIRNESDLLQRICRIIVDTGGYRMTWVGFAEEDAAKSVRSVAHSGFEKGYLDEVDITWSEGETGRGPAGTAIRTGQPVVARNILSDPTFAPWRTAAIQRGYASSAGLPLVVDGRTQGVLMIYAAEADAFGEEEVRLLQSLADSLAYGVQSLRTQAALKERELRYHDLYDYAPDMYVSVDSATGRIIQCNKTLERVMGYTNEELIGRPIFEMYDPADLPRVKELFVQFTTEGKLQNEELRLRSKDGRVFDVNLNTTAVCDESGRVISSRSVWRDISARRQAENNLIESERRFRALFENMAVGFVLFEVVPDDQDLPVDLIIIAANAGFEQATGLKLREVVGKRLTHVLPGIENDEADWIGTYGQVALTGNPRQLEQGSELLGFYYEVTAYQFGPKQCAVTFSDITARKQGEVEIRRAKEFNEKLIASMQDGLSVLDPEGVHLEVNPAFCEMTGYTREELIGGAPPHPYWAPEGLEAIQAALERILGGDFSAIELCFMRKNGEHFPVIVSPSCIRGADGVPTAYFAAVKDITGRKRAEEKIRMLNEELEQRVLDRTAELQAANEELEAFSYSVSHDLRAPLRAIDGFVRILEEDYHELLDVEGRRICKVISDSAHDMGRLIDDLLAFSRVGRITMKPSLIDMEGLVRASFLESTDAAMRDRIDFQVDQLPRGYADPALLRQVWANLIGNAIKFASIKERAHIEIKADVQGETVVYSVRDNGAGFDMRYVHKLFGVFQRLHRAEEFEGTGVGLAIVQRIVHRHGGRVWAEGEEGVGAAFYFTLKNGSAHD